MTVIGLSPNRPVDAAAATPSILRDYCSHNKVPFLSNSNITAKYHLNFKGLHLNKQGSLVLQNNLFEFANSFSA